MHQMQQYLLHLLIQHLAMLAVSIFQKGSQQQWHQIIYFEQTSKLYQSKSFSNMIQDNSEQEEGVFYDDLEDYQDQMGQKVCEDVMNYKHIVQDDAEHLQKSQSQSEMPAKKEMTQAERQARDMKLKNARKYFEVVKLTYIKEVNIALKQACFVDHNHMQIIGQFLSCLNKKLIQQYQKLRKTQPLSIKIQQVVVFLKKAKIYIKQSQLECNIKPEILFWSLFESLKITCRKIYFFDLGPLVQQTFYKLNYFYLEKAMKKQAKRAKEYQLIKIQIDLKKQQQEKTQGHNYIHFQDFQFNQNSFQKSIRSSSNTNKIGKKQSQQQPTQEQTQKDPLGLQARRQNNFLRKRNYKSAYFHIFSPSQDKWKLINSQILQFESQSECKSYLLSSKPIIGFYSLRLLHLKNQYQQLTKLKLFRRYVLEDLTMYFFDNMKNLTMRRKRVGVKYIMKELFDKGSFTKNRFMLESYDQYVMNKNDSIMLEFQLSNFPKSKQQMLNSEYFIIPSLLPQYSILDPKAEPINQQFNEEKVYLRKDLIPATSRMVWVDRGRKVKQGEIPVKKTENKSKNMSELFLYQQTQPYYLSIDEQTNNFIPDDQYNSVYVPPNYVFDNKFVVITKTISGICNKHNFRYVRLVQGFTHTIGRILPNYIGYLVYKEDEEKILSLWEERQKYLIENKQKNREKYLVALWTKLFTKIQISQWSHSFGSS